MPKDKKPLDMDDVQAEIGELLTNHVYGIRSALDCAESCETEADLRANVAEALKWAKRLVSELKGLV